MRWFVEKEFACKCCGQLPPQARENVKALVAVILDPLRERYGLPIKVSSGYRCEQNNLRCGGVKNSQHMCMEGSAAADISCGNNEELVRIIKEQGRFDQLIIYPTFIHVSYKRYGVNRHQVLKSLGNKRYTTASKSSTVQGV